MKEKRSGVGERVCRWYLVSQAPKSWGRGRVRTVNQPATPARHDLLAGRLESLMVIRVRGFFVHRRRVLM